MMKNPKIGVIILNWNGKEVLKKCLDSLKKNEYKNMHILVVDNASSDNSIDMLNKDYTWVDVLKLDKNYGFAKGNNEGIKYLMNDKKIKYFFILNNDTELEKDCISKLISVAESVDEKYGMFQPKILKMWDHSIIDSTGHVFKNGIIVDRGLNEKDFGQYDSKKEIIGCCAAAGLYKRKMLEEIGLYDESYWMYYEDAELSWRAYKHGWKAKFVPEAIVYHRRGWSSRRNKKVSEKLSNLLLINTAKTVKRYGNYKNKILFFLWLNKLIIEKKINLVFYLSACRYLIKTNTNKQIKNSIK